MSFVKNAWVTYSPYFSENITYITTPFYEAFINNLSKIATEAHGIYNSDRYKGEHGTYLYPGGQAVCFYTYYSINEETWRKIIFCFDKNELLAMYLGESTEGVGSGEIEFGRINEAPLVMLGVFINYCPIETKHLPPDTKISDIKCKYINETKHQIKCLDSAWFTNLVRSDAFKVRGHFRLQLKKKDGEWTKELIWISEFQKEGYTAPARKLA